MPALPPTPQPCRVLIWYWGRKGAGPLYAMELIRAVATQPGMQVEASIAAGNEMLAETRALGLPLDCVETYHDKASFIRAMLRLPAIRARFWRYLQRQRFDVVLSTMPHLWTPLLVDCVTASGAAYIPVLHDAMPHPGEAQPFWRWRRQRETRHAARIIALSAAVADGVARRTGFPRERISVIPYGIPAMPGLHSGARAFPAQRRFRFMFFGRIMAYKGLDILLAAYALLRQRRDDCELWIVGSGDCAPYAAALKELPDVTLVNRWIAEPEIPDILNQADAIMLPYREASQSGVTSQAYAAALPVAVTPVGGLVEQAATDVTGVVAEAATPAAFANAMDRLLDPVFYEDLSHRIVSWRKDWEFGAQGALYADLCRTAAAERAA